MIFQISTHSTMLTNHQLEQRCKATIPDFIGVFSRDTLPKKWQPGSYIVNLQGIDQGDKAGTHWVAFHLTPTELDYFDPFGSFIPTNVIAFAVRNHPNLHIRFSPWVFQGLNSQHCGMICYTWLLQGSHTGDFFNASKQIFKENEKENDKISYRVWTTGRLSSS